MADTVVKTVEDVDKLFSQIVVNGETYNSDRYVPPAPVQVIEEPEPEPQQTEISQNPSVPSGQTIQGEDVYAVVLNDEQHNFVDPEEVSSRTEADTTLQGNINSINALIPSDTTTSNKLVNESGIQDAVDTAVENAVADLDVPSVGGNGKYIKAISETNGKISATEGTIADTVESGNNNPVTSDAVNSAIAGMSGDVTQQIADAIGELDVASAGGSGKYISAISETDGKISAIEGTIDNVVTSGSNNPVTSDAVSSAISSISGDVTQQISDAIGALDVASAGGSGKYISAISETDGKISAIEGTIDNVVTSGSNNPVTGGAVNTAIESAIASIYKPAGDKTVAQLTSALLVAGNLGNVYNITDSGTTTSDFVEGAGKPISAGDNVAIVDTGSQGSPSYKFDLLSGFIDLSNYIQKSQTSGLVKNDGTVDTTVYASQSSLSSYIQKSQTQGLVKNDGTIDTTAYAKQSEMSVTPGTGADSDKTTIQLKPGTSATVLTQHIPAGTSTPVMDGTGSAGSSMNYAREDHVHPSDTSKQDVLTFDSVPTENSTNPVESGGIYTELQNITDIASSLPTDAVLHYSFDEVPDYPDGTAIEKHIKDFTSVPSDWDTNRMGVLSVANGEFINTVTNGTNAWFRRYFSSGAISGIVKVKVRASINCELYLQYYTTTYVTLVRELNAIANQEYTFTVFLPSTQFILVQGYTPTATDFQVVISEIYIGDGSYSTPIIDNANGQNNATNNGGIAVQGVSGKGVRFLGNGYIDGNLPWTPWDKQIFTFSCWVRNWDKNTSLYLFNNWLTYEISTLYVTFNPNGTNKITMDVCVNDKLYRFTNLILDFTQYNDMFIVCVFNGTSSRLYINGNKINLGNNIVGSWAESTKNRQNFQIGRVMGSSGYNYSKADCDDVQLFDRALSEKEVQALYQNKANTPKYYDLADYQLNNGEVVKSVCSQLPDSSGNVALTKSEVGLGNVENTGDSAVPVQNGITKFTTGGAFDFFAKSASAPSWLGKVFGRLMGRKWAQNNNIGTGYSLKAVFYANGLWVIGTTNHGLWWSEDGKSWTQVTSATGDSYFSSRSIASVYYANGLWLAGAYSGYNVYWSEDGKTWTQGTMSNPSNAEITGLAYGNNLWLASSSNTTTGGLWWSEDGKSWTKITGVTESTAIYTPVYDNSIWLTGGSKGLYKSTDGKVWTQILGDTTNTKVIYTPAFAGGLWVAGSQNDKLLWSEDSETWTPTASSVPGYTYTPTYQGGLWVAGSGISLYWSEDGKSWTKGDDSASHPYSPSYSNGLWISSYAVGLYWSEDGKNWRSATGRKSRAFSPIYAKGIWLALSNNGLWYSDIEMVLEDLTD